MMRFLTVLFAIFTFGHIALAQTAGKVDFGDLQTGSTVFFSQSINGEWGLEIVNDATVEFSHPQPINIEIQIESDKVQSYRLGYRDVQKQGDSILGSALFSYGNVVFKINDVWTIVESELSLKRTLQVKGSDSKIGFSSGIRISTPNTVKWPDLFLFVPGLFYADRHDVVNVNQNAPGLLQYREDVMPTPCLGLFYPSGVWMSLIHKELLNKPKQTYRSPLNVSSTINESFDYGVMSASENKLGGVELGFSMPGSLQAKQKKSSRISMYHPVKDGFQQHYTVVFQFGKHEFYRDMIQCLEQRIWENLTPNFSEQTLSSTRIVLADQLLSLVTKTGEITGLPMSGNAVSGNISAHLASANTIEAAALFIYEAELDKTDRGRAFRRQGLNLIESKIKLLSMNPPLGETFDVRNGLVQSFAQSGAYYVHHLSLEMNALMDLIQYEMTKGRQHIPWLEWVRSYGDWLLANQQLGGSFPLSMKNGTNEMLVEAGDLSYASIPFLVSLTKVTGNRKYLAAALNVAIYVWEIQGGQSSYMGFDQGQLRVDKASGMYAMEAFLSLYDQTKNKIWLERALSAAYYTISWIQTWNAPVSFDYSGNTVKWGSNFSTFGMQSVHQDGFGLRDQSLTYAIPGLARLSQMTGDTLLLKVAGLLMNSINIMMESNEQKIGLKSPGWKIDRWHVGFLKPTSANPDAWRTETTVQPLRGLTKLQLQHSDLLIILNKNSIQ